MNAGTLGPGFSSPLINVSVESLTVFEDRLVGVTMMGIGVLITPLLVGHRAEDEGVVIIRHAGENLDNRNVSSIAYLLPLQSMTLSTPQTISPGILVGETTTFPNPFSIEVENDRQRCLEHCQASQQGHGPLDTDTVVHGPRDQIDPSRSKISPAGDDCESAAGVDAVCVQQVMVNGHVDSGPREPKQYDSADVRPW